MKLLLIAYTFILCMPCFAQKQFPDFLTGNWKADNGTGFEHWDQLNESSLKGISYQMKDGRMVVSEYLEITRAKNGIVYTAVVLNQNEGKPVSFKLTKSDTVFHFQNPAHDFPKSITYKKLNDKEILVQVSDLKNKNFSYKLIKQFDEGAVADSVATNPNYDKTLAQKLGSDDYGMKAYYLVILKTGPQQNTDKDFVSEKFNGHMKNINALVEQGKLIVAGPLGKNDKTYRGIFILDKLTSIEEATMLLQTDPAIAAGLLGFEIFKWYGSAALPEYLPAADKIWKAKP